MEKGSVLWRRNQASEDDVWDDTDLIAAYDRAYSEIKKQIDKRTVSSSENSSVQEPPMGWKQGDYCTAVYSADKLPYEAKIKCIKGRHCTVHYIGYGNEERVLLAALQPSEGKEARRAQQARAGSRVHMIGNPPSSTQRHIGIPALPCEPPWSGNASGLPNPGSSSVVPVIPPPPPPSVFKEGCPDSEALSSMLMSWYMSGYHTGYYEAVQQSQQADGHHHNNCH